MDSSRIFLEGPAGVGKTTAALNHVQQLLAQGAAPDNVLVLVPQRILGEVYRLANQETLRRYPGDITMLTLGGVARRNVERFWPLVAESVGFNPAYEPTFLTIETAQYYMMRFTREWIAEGVFDSISLAPPRIAAQLLDNMAKAAIAGFPFSEVAERLGAAWGDRHSSRLQVYQHSQMIGEQYRAYCHEYNLLDYALQIEVFMEHLVAHEVFQRYFLSRHHHLVADNIEEMGPRAHEFITMLWPHWESALLIYDIDGGYRTFLGADPDHAVGLKQNCDVQTWDDSLVLSDQMQALVRAVQQTGINPDFRDLPAPEVNPRQALVYSTDHIYYPQMIDWTVQNIVERVGQGVPLSEIVILAPFLTDALRFSLQHKLEEANIPVVSHRPSRAIRDEPAARALLTLIMLAHPQWDFPPPPKADIVDMLIQVIDGLDPVRAGLLANIVYKPQYGGTLSSFEDIQTAVRERITYQVGEKYEQLRDWLLMAQQDMTEKPVPLDYFLSRLFGELLSQAGFGFHTNLDGGRIAAQLIESTRKFRQILYPVLDEEPDWNAAGYEYTQLVNEGVLAALYTSSWREEEVDAVLIAPAFTFLMRNRIVDYQFWLDVGSSGWWDRLDQPLTHPYVLMKNQPKTMWTEQHENEMQAEMLYRTVIGLLRRCRQQVYLGISDLGEQGYEQRGPMLFLFQQILQRYSEEG